MKLSRNQQILVIILLTSIVIVIYFIIQHQLYGLGQDMKIALSTLFTVLVTTSITLVNFPIFRRIKLDFPIKKDIFKRLTIGFFLSSLSAATIITAWVFIFYFFYGDIHKLEIKEAGWAQVIHGNIVIAIIVNFIIGSIYILRHAVIGWKETIIEAEQYKRQSIESQYKVLLNQINPHFLFNSMNALASLIPKSPEKAVDFVNKFSKIYRYVLDVKEKIVCEVKEELDFLESYCYLQEIRFGNNLLIEKEIDALCLNCFLPPLSLQLLIENAIKHNEISKSSPLKIKIKGSENNIIVTNNLKPKIIKQESTGIGLKNLEERFNHLTEVKPEFFIQNNEYIAKIPLIKEED